MHFRDPRDPGILESWDSGIPGILESWNPGIPGIPGILESRNPGIQESWNPGIPEILEFLESWNPGIQETAMGDAREIQKTRGGENDQTIWGARIEKFYFFSKMKKVSARAQRARRNLQRAKNARNSTKTKAKTQGQKSMTPRAREPSA